ncbi:ankyrin repeat domain-containing protein [Nonomuraea sp. LPB2021202275-12-8]|uniref:ankyrin repeat domain-containing protein n=1 Tax=Nonomuraea sp. LPB2021202275-12-8 TaxID=3120159 RepID=UPI00300C74C7
MIGAQTCRRSSRSAVTVADGAGWSDLGWKAWTNLTLIRARLDAGADPDAGTRHNGPPLHEAAGHGSPDVVEELVRRVDDVDAEHDGRTALWLAVFANRPDNARALAAAGADPWRPMTAGWSPGRLSLATPTPDLFPAHPGEPGLSTAETAAVTLATATPRDACVVWESRSASRVVKPRLCWPPCAKKIGKPFTHPVVCVRGACQARSWPGSRRGRPRDRSGRRPSAG